MKMTRSQCKAWQKELPIGNPHGGPAYGEKRDFVGDLVGDVFGGITGSKQAAQAAGEAGQLQYLASMAGVDENKRQFDKLVQLMSPFVGAGAGAIGAQQNLIGLGGEGAQQDAIRALERGPAMSALLSQGENAMRQNAAATGGLRGGNFQATLAQFRPQLLNQLIQNQYSNLGGLAQLGQAAAAGQAGAGMQSASQIGQLLAQGGAAQAGAQLAQGNVTRQTLGDMMGIAKGLAGIF